MVVGPLLSYIVHASSRAAPDRFLVNRWIELAVVACVFSAIAMAMIKMLGLSARLRHHRHGLLAAAYEMFLYRRSPRAVLHAEARLIWHNVLFILWLAPALVFGGGLFAITYDVMEGRYGRAPISAEKEFVVQTTSLRDDRGLSEAIINQADFVVTADVRVPALGMSWTRLLPARRGILRLNFDGRAAWINVASPERPTHAAQYPGDIEVRVFYPPRHPNYWIWGFVILSVALSWPLARIINVEM